MGEIFGDFLPWWCHFYIVFYTVAPMFTGSCALFTLSAPLPPLGTLIDGGEDKNARGWGGRQFSSGAAALIAMLVASKDAYAVALGFHMVRGAIDFGIESVEKQRAAFFAAFFVNTAITILAFIWAIK